MSKVHRVLIHPEMEQVIMKIEEAKFEILREAAKQGNQICKLPNPDGDFVKVKRAYCQTDELRSTYLAALDALVLDGSIKFVFKSKDFELYEVTARSLQIMTVQHAKERLLAELKANGSVYKVHSDRGEFVQMGDCAFDEMECERILFMQALHELLHHGTIQVFAETREICKFEIAPRSSSGYVQYAHQ
jgi:hypothetical protein